MGFQPGQTGSHAPAPPGKAPPAHWPPASSPGAAPRTDRLAGSWRPGARRSRPAPRYRAPAPRHRARACSPPRRRRYRRQGDGAEDGQRRRALISRRLRPGGGECPQPRLHQHRHEGHTRRRMGDARHVARPLRAGAQQAGEGGFGRGKDASWPERPADNFPFNISSASKTSQRKRMPVLAVKRSNNAGLRLSVRLQTFAIDGPARPACGARAARPGPGPRRQTACGARGMSPVGGARFMR